MQVNLPSEQAELLRLCAYAYQQPGPMGQKEPIIFYSAMGAPTMAQHPGLPDGTIALDIGDLQQLAVYGLFNVTWRDQMSGHFRVTNEGYDAVEQIERHDEALASSGAVPTERAGMGLNWETEVFPVLKTVHDLYSPAVSPKGVLQPAINDRLGREEQDPRTDLVLRKLEEAGYIKGVIRVAAFEGPLGSEPASKALELLGGWPTDRGDAALARLIGALEKRIEEAADPVEKGKLQRVLDSVQEVGQGIMVGVLTNVITGGS